MSKINITVSIEIGESENLTKAELEYIAEDLKNDITTVARNPHYISSKPRVKVDSNVLTDGNLSALALATRQYDYVDAP